MRTKHDQIKPALKSKLLYVKSKDSVMFKIFQIVQIFIFDRYK